MTSLTYRKIQRFIVDSLAALGSDPASAAKIAQIFLRAQHREQGHHDLSYLPERLGWLHDKRVNAAADPKLVSRRGSTSVFDGGNCLGELACSTIVGAACDAALEFGTGLSVVRNSNHFLAGQPYGELASERGCILLLFSSTDRTMTGPDGGVSIIGNNPVLFSFPVPGRPFILDMCMAYASLGTLKKRAREGHTFDLPAGFDSSGRPSTDPSAILDGGSLAPMGRHKGFGLALFVELLAGGLSGGHLGLEIPAGGGVSGHSQAALAIDPSVFGGAEQIGRRFIAMVEDFAREQTGIRYPGSRLAPWSDAMLDSRVELGSALLDKFDEWATRLGVAPPGED